MLTYIMDDRGNTPLYEYLYQCIKDDILAGKMAYGEKLPSKRALAKHLDIAVITVENAYAQLLMEGYIISKEKSGYFVSDIGLQAQQTIYQKVIQSKQKSFGVYPYEDSLKKTTLNKKLDKNGINPEEMQQNQRAIWADFTGNHSSEESFPYATWSRLMRRVLADHQNDFTGKTPSAGIPELREAIAEYLRKNRGMDVDARRIIVGPGTEYLHSILIPLIGRTRIVAVEDPGYKKVGQIYEINGMKVFHMPVDEEGLIVKNLYGSNVRLVHTSPSHHFPTGCVMSAKRRHQLLDWATNQDGYVVEDDYDSEFRFQGRPIPTLASLDDKRVIYMNTFTKTLAPSIRIAYMVLPESLSELYHKKLGFYSGSVSTFEQYTLALFIGEGYYERHISRMRNRYRKTREELLDQWKRSALSEITEILEDKSGLHFILKCRYEIDDDFVSTALLDKGIRIAQVREYCYSTGKNYRGMFVLNYTTELQIHQLQEGFARINAVLREAIENWHQNR